MGNFGLKTAEYVLTYLQIFQALVPLVLLPAKKNMSGYISYDVTVIQWITSCHKYVMTTRYITLLALTSNVMTTSVTTMQLFDEINKH